MEERQRDLKMFFFFMFICLHIKNRILMSNVLLLKNHFRDIYFGIILRGGGRKIKRGKRWWIEKKGGRVSNEH